MVRLAPSLRPLFPYLKWGYVRSTRAVAPASMLLSRAFDGQLPTGIAPTLERAATSSGGTFRQVRPAEPVPLTRPAGVPRDHPSFATTDEPVPPVGVAELPGGRVLGPHHALVTRSGDLVHDISYYFGTTAPREHPLFLHPFAEPAFDVPGRLGVLATRGDSNYYHFLIDSIARLGVLEQCPDVETPERWYVAAGASFQRQILAMVGVAEDSIVDASAHPHVAADCLVVPGLPATEALNPPWAVQYLRQRLMPEPVEGSGGPIYVSRGPSKNNRSVLNEDEVFGMLRERGYVYVDPGTLSVREQIETFARASEIVAPHGAGLTNLMFASPGTRVVELFPSAAVLQNCYWRMADAVGLDYRYLAGTGQTARGGLGGGLVRDMVVDLDALTALLD